MSVSVGAVDIKVTFDASATKNLDKQIKNALKGATTSAKGLTSELNKVEKATSNATKPFITLRSVAGRALSAFSAISAARGITRFVNESVQEFNRLEQGITEIQSLLDNFDQANFAGFEEQIDRIAGRFGSLSQDVVPAFYQSISSGVAEIDVSGFVGIADQLAQVGLVGIDVSVDGLTAVTNAYANFQDGALSATEAADILFATVQGGRLRFGELAKFIGQVTPIASQAGVSFQEVSAGLVAITKQGIPARKAATFLRQAFIELGRDGTKSATAFTEATGQGFREFIAQDGNDIVDVFRILDEQARSTGNTIANSFNSIEAAQAASALVANTEAFATALDRAGKSQNIVNDAALEFARTNQGQLQILAEEAESLQIALGRNLSGPFLEFREVLVRSLLPALAEFASAIGPAVLNNLETFSGTLLALTPIVTTLAKAFGLLPPQILQLGAAFKLLQIGSQTAAFAGLSSALTNFANRGKIAAAAQEAQAAAAARSAKNAGILAKATQDAIVKGGATGAQYAVLAKQQQALSASADKAAASVSTLTTRQRAASSAGRAFSKVFTTGNLALAAATVAFSVYTTKTQDAAERNRELQENVQEVTRALTDESGAIDLTTESIERFVASQDAQFNSNDQAREAASQLGLTYSELQEILADPLTVDFSRFRTDEFKQITEDGKSFTGFVDSITAGIATLSGGGGGTIGLNVLGQRFEDLNEIAAELDRRGSPALAGFFREIDEGLASGRINQDEAIALIKALSGEAVALGEAADEAVESQAKLDGATGRLGKSLVNLRDIGGISADDFFSEEAANIFIARSTITGRAIDSGIKLSLVEARELLAELGDQAPISAEELAEFEAQVIDTGGSINDLQGDVDGLIGAFDRLNGVTFDKTQARIDSLTATTDFRELFSQTGTDRIDTAAEFIENAGDVTSFFQAQVREAELLGGEGGQAILDAARQAFIEEFQNDLSNEQQLLVFENLGIDVGSGIDSEDLSILIEGLGGGTSIAEAIENEIKTTIGELDLANVDSLDLQIPVESFLELETNTQGFVLNPDLIADALDSGSVALVDNAVEAARLLLGDLNTRLADEDNNLSLFTVDEISSFRSQLAPFETTLEEFAALDPSIRVNIDSVEALADLGLVEGEFSEFANVDDITKQIAFEDVTPGVIDELVSIYGSLALAPPIVKEIIFRGRIEGGVSPSQIIRESDARAGNIPQSEFGRIVRSPMITSVGEKFKPEVIIPLTKPRRAAQLVEQSNLLDIIGYNKGPSQIQATINPTSTSTASTVVDRSFKNENTYQITGSDPREIANQIDILERRRMARFRR